MFPSFIGILDIQSWWEVPSIAHFCSLFRAAFNLLDFDIEELEEALLTDGTEESASSLLTELIVRLLCGCLGNNDISAFNYQMFLRRLFRQKCQETGRYNPFNTDIDFQFLPLRTKVEILYALCDFRLDADDVFELFKNLEAESLRVEPLGWDDNSSAYWYFYGTRLYREDYKVKTKGKKRKGKEDKRIKKKCDEVEDDTERVWQVVCFTEADWVHLTEKFKESTSRIEKDLFQSLSENFLPEIPRLFQEKERLQRKRFLKCVPRRTSTRVQTKKQKEEEESKHVQDTLSREKKIEEEIQQHKKKTENSRRESRARRREQLRCQSGTSSSVDSLNSGSDSESGSSMWSKRKRRKVERGGSSSAPATIPPPPRPSGRQTNNSLACATGQILIPDIQEPTNPTRKKMKTSQIYELLDEEVQTDMYKVLEQLKSHEDAWPFMDPVEEEFAPNYYTVIRRPMDLQRMEYRLDSGFYTNFNMFKNDFKLIVNNCRLYNGQDNEYTLMVDNLEAAFNKLTQRYFDRLSSSDDEIAIEYPIQNPSPRKQPPKSEKKSKQENLSKKKNNVKDEKDSREQIKESEKRKHKDEDSKRSKKLKLEHDDYDSDKISDNSVHQESERNTEKSHLHTKKKKKGKGLSGSQKSHKGKHKKPRQKRKHSKHGGRIKKKKSSRRLSFESQRSHSSSRSMNESIPKEEPCIAKKRHFSPEIDFYKDKFDKIKERRRGSSKTIPDHFTEKYNDKTKSNLILPDKDKNLNLKETIEKLKAKSEKNDSTSIYSDIYESESSLLKNDKCKFSDFESHCKNQDQQTKKKSADEYEFIDDDDDRSNDVDKHVSNSNASAKKLSKKQSNTKNESATEALEQAVKDISKWLDDTPKLSEFSSNSNSPLQIPITDEYLPSIIKQDDENSSGLIEKDKSTNVKKDQNKKRLVTKDGTKSLTRRKEVQRTIERLQPGKSKGNLITNIQLTSKPEENIVIPSVKSKEVKSSLIMKTDEGSPKLSLGTVLPTVGFGLGKQHNFNNEANATNVKVEVVDTGTMTCETEEIVAEEEKQITPVVEEVEIPKEEVEYIKANDISKQCQEKATPNLSAWFKAFGAPKTGSTTSTSTSTTTTTSGSKKRFDETDQDDSKYNDLDAKNTSPIECIKNEHTDDLLTPDGGESPIPNLGSTIRARRTSTGSSISERSSFSQDLDSPRHQPSHPSPLLRSPASPRTEEHQKSYPLMNVTVRVGFYQDTASVKSSPEKSCSPREAPQSPYAAYSQHVYAASANVTNSANSSNTYVSEGPNKSPLPAYAQTQQPPSYYETSKPNTPNKTIHQDEYAVYPPDNVYQQPSSPFQSGPFSPGQSPYSHHSQHSPYSHIQHSPQTFTQPATVSNIIQATDRRTVVEKPSAFPVKKRTYNEQSSENSEYDQSNVNAKPSSSNISDNMSHSLIDTSPLCAEENNRSTFTSSVTTINNPSVITSASSKNIKNSIQYVPSPELTNKDISKCATVIQEDTSNKTLEVQHTQYTDFVSDYSLKKTQINDFSLVGLSKSHVDSGISVYQEPQLSQSMCNPALFSEMKNISKVVSQELSVREKSVDMINMGFTTKMMENRKNKESGVDMVNMGYLLPDSTNPDIRPSHAHIAKISSNTDETRNIRNFNFYNTPSSLPYTGRSEQNSQAVAKVTTTNEYVENNKRYSYDKSSSVLQYQKTTMDACPSMNSDNLLNNLAMKQMYSENTDSIIKDNVNKSPSLYKDWKMDSIKKNHDPHNLSLYKDQSIKSDNKMSISQMATSAMSGQGSKSLSSNMSYDSSNAMSMETDETQQKSELRIPIIRAVIEISSSIKPESQQPSASEYNLRRNVNLNLPVVHNKSENNYDRNLPLTSSNTYKSHNQPPSHPIDASLMNIPNLPQIMERYAKDERMLSSYPTPVSTPCLDKSMSLMYPKNVPNIHSGVPTNQIFQPSSISKAYNRDMSYSPNMQSNPHNLSVEPISLEAEKKVSKSRKKKANVTTSISQAGPSQPSFHSYPGLKSGLPSNDQSMALKPTNMLTGSAFNFGATGSLGPGLYGDGSCFLEGNQYMAANYMAAHQRTAPEADKGGKPAHQQTPHNPFQFLARPGYPLVDPAPALYQQYLQRRQEELLRHSTSQMMGLFPPPYPITRPSWL